MWMAYCENSSCSPWWCICFKSLTKFTAKNDTFVGEIISYFITLKPLLTRSLFLARVLEEIEVL